jgi:hypothetical protein
MRVKGYHFEALDSVQKAVTDSINNLTEAGFQSCYDAHQRDVILKEPVLI